MPYDSSCCTACHLSTTGEHDPFCTGYVKQPTPEKTMTKVVNQRFPVLKTTTSTTTAATHESRLTSSGVSTTTGIPSGSSDSDSRPGLVESSEDEPEITITVVAVKRANQNVPETDKPTPTE